MAEGFSGLSSASLPIISAASLASGSTGDKALFMVPYKCELVRFWIVWEGADNNATAAIVDLDKRITGGSDTGRVDKSGAAMTLKKTTAVNEQGKYVYKDPTSRVTAKEGEQFVVEVTTAQGAALAFTAGIIIREIPEVAGNNTNMQLTA